MKKTSMFSFVGFLVCLLISFPARATDFYVHVSFYSLSPSTVHVKSGDVVYWVEADDLGPYMISGAWGDVLTPYGIQFSVGPGTYNYSVESAWGGGGWNGTVVVDPNFRPTVSITSPTNNAIFTAPASFSFEANAADANPNDISDVEFWIGNTMVDDVLTPPYATEVTNLPVGTYTLRAVVWDNSYATATNLITVKVVEPGPISVGGCSVSEGKLIFRAGGLTPGTTNVLQCSTNMIDWFPIQTNICDGLWLDFTNTPASRIEFFRIMQVR